MIRASQIFRKTNKSFSILISRSIISTNNSNSNNNNNIRKDTINQINENKQNIVNINNSYFSNNNNNNNNNNNTNIFDKKLKLIKLIYNDINENKSYNQFIKKIEQICQLINSNNVFGDQDFLKQFPNDSRILPQYLINNIRSSNSDIQIYLSEDQILETIENNLKFIKKNKNRIDCTDSIISTSLWFQIGQTYFDFGKYNSTLLLEVYDNLLNLDKIDHIVDFKIGLINNHYGIPENTMEDFFLRFSNHFKNNIQSMYSYYLVMKSRSLNTIKSDLLMIKSLLEFDDNDFSSNNSSGISTIRVYDKSMLENQDYMKNILLSLKDPLSNYNNNYNYNNNNKNNNNNNNKFELKNKIIILKELLRNNLSIELFNMVLNHFTSSIEKFDYFLKIYLKQLKLEPVQLKPTNETHLILFKHFCETKNPIVIQFLDRLSNIVKLTESDISSIIIKTEIMNDSFDQAFNEFVETFQKNMVSRDDLKFLIAQKPYSSAWIKLKDQLSIDSDCFDFINIGLDEMLALFSYLERNEIPFTVNTIKVMLDRVSNCPQEDSNLFVLFEILKTKYIYGDYFKEELDGQHSTILINYLLGSVIPLNENDIVQIKKSKYFVNFIHAFKKKLLTIENQSLHEVIQMELEYPDSKNEIKSLIAYRYLLDSYKNSDFKEQEFNRLFVDTKWIQNEKVTYSIVLLFFHLNLFNFFETSTSTLSKEMVFIIYKKIKNQLNQSVLFNECYVYNELIYRGFEKYIDDWDFAGGGKINQDVFKRGGSFVFHTSSKANSNRQAIKVDKFNLYKLQITISYLLRMNKFNCNSDSQYFEYLIKSNVNPKDLDYLFTFLVSNKTDITMYQNIPIKFIEMVRSFKKKTQLQSYFLFYYDMMVKKEFNFDEFFSIVDISIQIELFNTFFGSPKNVKMFVKHMKNYNFKLSDIEKLLQISALLKNHKFISKVYSIIDNKENAQQNLTKSISESKQLFLVNEESIIDYNIDDHQEDEGYQDEEKEQEEKQNLLNKLFTSNTILSFLKTNEDTELPNIKYLIKFKKFVNNNIYRVSNNLLSEFEKLTKELKDKEIEFTFLEKKFLYYILKPLQESNKIDLKLSYLPLTDDVFRCFNSKNQKNQYEKLFSKLKSDINYFKYDKDSIFKQNLTQNDNDTFLVFKSPESSTSATTSNDSPIPIEKFYYFTTNPFFYICKPVDYLILINLVSNSFKNDFYK